MDQKELYKHGFDKLCPSENFEKELLLKMENKKTSPLRMRKIVTLAAAAALAVSLAIAASATGALESVRLWINGKEVEDATQYMDENGNMVVQVENGEDDSVYVIMEDGELPADGKLELTCVPPTYAHKDGRDYLVFTEEATGKTECIDITDELVNGVYQNDALEVFGVTGSVYLQVNGEDANISWNVAQ